jgi:hypothetical protein
MLPLIHYVEREGVTMGFNKPWMPLGGIVTVVALVGVIAGGAAAKPDSGAKSAALTGTSVWALKAYTIGGTIDGRLAHGTYTGTLTGGDDFSSGDCGPVCEPVTGTITFSARNGDFTAAVQPGSVVALEDIASRSIRTFTLYLQVVSGTRSYGHANGQLTLSYSSLWSHYFDSDGHFVNTIEDSGTLTGSAR